MAKTPKDPKAPPTSSQRDQRQHELKVLAGEARQFSDQDLGFCAREFVLCGLPYKRQESLLYERQNGSFALRIEASPRFGMPYGQDRLIPIWLATAFYSVGCPEDGKIYVRFASDILRAFGTTHRPLSGTEIKRLRERLERIFGATYYVRDNTFPRSWREEGYRLIRRVSLWFDQKFRPNQYAQGESYIQLSRDFVADLRRAVIPIDLNTIRALKQQPAALDLYIWQAWRSYRLGRLRGIGSPRDKDQEPLRVYVFGVHGLRWQLGTATTEPYKARQMLRNWQQQVKEAWPQCPNDLSEDGDYFLIRPAQATWLGARVPFVGAVRRPRLLKKPLSPRPPRDPSAPRPDLYLTLDPEEEPPPE